MAGQACIADKSERFQTEAPTLRHKAWVRASAYVG